MIPTHWMTPHNLYGLISPCKTSTVDLDYPQANAYSQSRYWQGSTHVSLESAQKATSLFYGLFTLAEILLQRRLPRQSTASPAMVQNFCQCKQGLRPIRSKFLCVLLLSFSRTVGRQILIETIRSLRSSVKMKIPLV